MLRYKKLICSVLAVVQASYPLTVSAAGYFYRTPIREVKAGNGVHLPVVNVDPSNTTTKTTRAGEAVLRVAPAVVDFGTIPATKSSAIQTITLYNVGGKSLTLGALSATSQFSVTSGCDGVVVPPLGNCQVNVTFAPTEITSDVQVTGKLSVPFSSGEHSAVTHVDLTGKPASPPAGAIKEAELDGLSDVQADGSVSFPLAIINQQSWPKTFKIRSSGDAPLDFKGLSFQENDGSFSATSDCPSSIAVGTECSVTVVFAPQTVGPKTATLVVGTSSYRGNNLPVSLSGEAIELYPVYGKDSTAMVDFGEVVQGGAAGARIVTIQNSGTAPLTIGTVSLQGPSVAGLTLGASTCNKPVPVGGSCTISLSYSATTTGVLDAKLMVPHDGRLTPASPVSLPITGSVVVQSRTLSFNPSLDFGTVDAGVATTRALTITNTGNSPVSGITLSSASPFTPAPNTCTGQTIQPAGTCTVTYSLTSSTNGPLTRVVTVSATNLTSGTPSLVLQGTVQTRAIAALAPSSLAFGLQTSGVWSADERTVTVTNSGNVNIKPAVVGRLDDNTVSGAPWVRVSSDTCSAGLAPGASCVIGLQVRPTTSSAVNTSVTVAPDTGMTTGTRTVSVSTTGTAQSYSISATNLNFGTVGSLQYAERNITVTNTSQAGTVVTGFSGVAITQPTTPANSGTISVPASTCSTNLASQASCTMTVRFTAASYADAAELAVTGGAVSFYWSGARSTGSIIPVAVAIVGSTVTASASGSDFGDIPAGVAAASAKRLAVSVNNTGAYPVTLGAALLDSANTLAMVEDTAATGRCVAGAALPAGASCTHTVYTGPASSNGGGQKSSSLLPRLSSLGKVVNVGTALPFTGNVLPASISTSTDLVDFGAVGEKTVVSKTFTFQTSHGGAAQYAAAPVTGAGYSITMSGCSSGSNLAAGATCTATVTFNAGTFTAEEIQGSVALRFTVDGVQKTLATVGFKAQVEKASYAIDYNDLNWGDVPTQTAGQPRYAVLRNTSTNAVIPITSRTVALPFAISTGTGTFTYNNANVVNCTTLAQLNPGQSCYVNVSLSGNTSTSAGSGPFSGNATIVASTSAGSMTVPMTANFLVANPQMANSVTFENPTPSTTSHNPDMPLTITNIGGGRMYWTNAAGGSTTFHTTGNFWLVTANGGAVQALNTASVANSTRCEGMSYLEPGASCTLTVRFTPTGTAQAKTGQLKIGTVSPAVVTHTVNLSGVAQAGVMFMNQSALDFGQQLVASSTTQTVLIGNGGDAPMSIRSVSRTRADGSAAAYASEFTAAHDCPTALQPGESCIINVTFTPDRNLNFGTLSNKEIVSFQHYTNGAWSTTQIPLAGIGHGSQLTASEQVHDLGYVDRDIVNYDYNKTVTFTASGPAPVRITSFAAKTMSYLETRVGGTCATNLTLQPGQSCSMVLRNRNDFSAYTAGSAFNQVQDVFAINGSFYKDSGAMQSDRSVQLLATGTIVTPATLAEVAPRVASTSRATPAAVFGTGLRTGAKVFIDEVEVQATFVSANELRFTIPAGLTVGSHTVRVVNTDGLNLSKTIAFTVGNNDVSTDPTLDVRTVGYDRPYVSGGTATHAAALSDGRLVHVATNGTVQLTDVSGNVTSTASISANSTMGVIKASASGNAVTVAWLSTYYDAFCYNSGYYGCRGETIYYDTRVYLNMQTFTVSGSTLTTGTRYTSTIYSLKNGPSAPAFALEAFDVSRAGSQTLVAFSTSVFGTRTKGVQIWNGSSAPGTLYDLPVQSGSLYAMGAHLQGNVAFVRWGDRVYTYDVAGTTLSGGTSYQYSGALASDAGDGLGFSAATGELFTSCYSNRAVCVIPTAGSALGTASLMAGDTTASGYVDGSYNAARFAVNFVGSHPDGALVVQSSTPQASRVVKRQ